MTSRTSDCWPFRSHPPHQTPRKGNSGMLYEIPLQPAPSIPDPRPGERRDSMHCNLGPLRIVSRASTALVCWHRFKVWWIRPVFTRNVPPETILVLFLDNEDNYRVIMTGESCALVQLDSDCVVTGSRATARLYCGMGTDPFALIRDGAEQLSGIKAHRGNVVRRYLGWCTWNAFYTQISGGKLVEAVRTVKQVAPIRWMILDDGWQHTTNDEAQNGQQWKERLASLKESPSKFQDMPLKDAIAQIKTMGVDEVWVWHTLMGYWLGVEGEQLYYPHFPSGIIENDRSSSQEASAEHGIGLPSPDFIDHYHTYLESCGVAGVKVDAQGVVPTLRPYKWNEEKPMHNVGTNERISDFHEALARSVQTRFDKNIIHCMSHAPEIIYQLGRFYGDSRPLMRASDDFYPDNQHSHGPHVVACAFNSILLSQLSTPDWDMFWTTLSDARMVRLHAVSRCLSGGPVYISDEPSRVNRKVVDWICCDNGTVLLCRDTAFPIERCLLQDPLAWDSDPFVIFNTDGKEDCVTSGVLGVFHVAGSGAWDYDKLDYVPVHDRLPTNRKVKVQPADVPQFAQANTAFLALPFFSPKQAIVLPNAKTNIEMELEPLACDSIAILPIHRVGSTYEMVLLGIRGKINGAGSVLDVHVNKDDFIVSMSMVGCGFVQYGIRPTVTTHVLVDGKQLSTAKGSEEKIAGFSIVTFKLETSDEVRRIDITLAN